MAHALRFALALSILTFPLAAQERARPSIDQLLSVNSLIGGSDAPQWAPDGSRIVFLSGLDGGLWTISPSGGFPVRLAGGIASGIFSRATTQLSWSPDGKSIAYVKGGEIFQWNLADGSTRRLTRLAARVGQYSFAPDGQSIAFSNNRYGSYDIWTVSLADGRTRRVTRDARHEVFPAWTPDGRKLLYTRLDDAWVDHDVFEISPSGEQPRLVLSDKDYFDYRTGAAFGFVRTSPDGKTVLFRSQRSGWANYWLAPLAGGAPRPLAAEAADQSDARWSPDGKSVLFLSITNGTRALKVAALDGGAVRAVVAPTMGMVGRAEWSPDGSRISYTQGTPTQAEDLYVVASAGGAPTQLTFSDQGGNLAADLVVPEKVSWVNEGHTINAYLYRPRNLRAGERVPVIMYVHGGPTSQFSDNYQLQPQFFASRGYAVLAPNVRGSSGYGRKFEDANNRDWGHGDLRDVVAGVEWAKRQPYVNPERVGITGVSYGGMLTMYAVSFAPGVFQAAISGSGYGDVREFHTKVLVQQHSRLLDFELGKWPSTPAVDSIYRRSSSILRARDATAPTMLIHGYGLDEFDTYSPALEFARELRKHDKIAHYKAYPGETYYVYRADNTRQMLLDMLEFFDQYLRDDVPPRDELARGAR